ncbi:hypothetical protein [Chryseosolibacter indicus]|uniref:HNH endonuclease n=1 Tax=Chryseosolibacter indicus TaxID=2782351 RepID=A0ABS5VWB1_9BACT|nr:hypothetical protein [Chryseosolibacter indicus]MBT1705019.1 hypothetical protein [Chryseosolibacter indicus]
MEVPEFETTNNFIRIPKTFRNSETGKLFSNCLVCEKYLLNEGTPYVIEKAVKQHHEVKVKEVIFEYAMCMECVVVMNNALSNESRERIQNYFAENTNLEYRSEELLKHKSLRTNRWVSHCLIKKTPISKSPEYQLVAQCDGKYMVFTAMPFALSMEAMGEISSLLSAKSLGEMDDFIGRYFTGPPEVSEILKKRLILV